MSLRRLADDRGSLAPAMPIIFLLMLVLGGLVVDGTRELNLRGRAQAYAEEAARAGASAVDLQSVVLALNKSEALRQATQYCTDIGADLGSQLDYCRVDPQIYPVSNTDARELVVKVSVRLRMDTTLLGITGISNLTASGTATARPYEGLDAGDAN